MPEPNPEIEKSESLEETMQKVESSAADLEAQTKKLLADLQQLQVHVVSLENQLGGNHAQ